MALDADREAVLESLKNQGIKPNMPAYDDTMRHFDPACRKKIGLP